MSLALAATACGYGFTAAGGRLAGGAEAVAVAPFENLSTEPALGAAVAAAVREELAARGLLGAQGAVLEGEVSTAAPAPAAPDGAAWRTTLELRARLSSGDRVLAERHLRREAVYAAGMDPLETEGRRSQALRRLAAELARELVASLRE